MKKIILTLHILMAWSASATEFKETKVISVGYFNKIYGHVHQNPFRYSLGLTTISCGHPMKILEAKLATTGKFQESFSDGWRLVKVGPYIGYIHGSFISDKKVECFQDKYPKFFEKFEMEISDMYYWGKLYDQYLMGKTKAQ